MRLVPFSIAVYLVGTCASLSQTFDGTYTARGSSPDGQPYEMPATISGADTIGCRVTWGGADASSWASCIRTGNSLALAFMSGEQAAVALYVLQADGSLEGKYLLPGATEYQTETMTPQPPAKEK